MESFKRITKGQKEMYYNFINREDIKETLELLPKSDHLGFLRRAFEDETGIRVSRYMAYNIKKFQVKEVEFNGKTYKFIGGKSTIKKDTHISEEEHAVEEERNADRGAQPEADTII